jgi:hypothetical protein
VLSQKLLVDVGVDTFAGENRYQRRKSTSHSTCIASFHPLAVMSGPGHHLEAFNLKDKAPTGIWARVKGLSSVKLLVMSFLPAI